jgi:AraC-like DNA-binding protein
MLIPSDLISFLYIAMMISSFLVSIIYICYHWHKGLFGKFTSLALFFISYGVLTIFAAANGLFQFLPWIPRTGLLMIFIIVPLIFLAVDRGIREMSIKRSDWLHGTPALLYIINYLPYWVKPQTERLSMIDIQNFAKYDEGWIFPAYSLSVLAFILVLVYTFSIFQIMKSPSLEQSSAYSKRKVLIFCLYLIFLLVPILLLWTGHYSGFKRGEFNLVFIIGNLLFFLTILSIPELIYDLVDKRKGKGKNFNSSIDIKKVTAPRKDYEVIAEIPNEKVIKIKLTIEEESFLTKLNTYLENELPFTNNEFSQSILAEKIETPVYLVRKHLKSIYHTSFNEYINRYRIRFLIIQLNNKKEWRNYNVGSLAAEIGFKSVNSLYLNFKKVTGTTPKEFIIEIEKSIQKD